MAVAPLVRMKIRSNWDVLGRLLVAGVFIGAGLQKARAREATRGYMETKGLPGGALALGGALAVELGVAPLFALGVSPRYTAAGLLAFLAPASLVFHDFWNQQGDERQNQAIHFMKNLAIMGGLLGYVRRDIETARAEKLRGVQSGVYAPRPTYAEAA